MAPVKQPASLYQLTISSLSGHIDQACANIFLEHGVFGKSVECSRAIKRLQHHLVMQLPLTVFEHLVRERNRSRIRTQYCWSDDQRIKLGVFLHPNIAHFEVDNKGNELMQHQDDGLDEMFWCNQIHKLVNLTHLSLNLITTDEILICVGNSCPKLEVINIVSRIRQDISTDHTPGITLKFCVSDIGLRSLQNCRNLKRITMNKIVNHHHANQGISLVGVRDLMRALPKLEFISFGALGKILCSDHWNEDQTLKLTTFCEVDPMYVNVERLVKICPHIQHISLSVPLVIGANGNINANNKNCTDILMALANSSLTLRIVELQHFPYGEAFQALLKSKGHTIVELLFRASEAMHSEHLIFIGKQCPNLTKLHLKEVGMEERPLGFTPEIRRLRLFSKLSFVHISGRLWNPNVIIPLLLYAALDIKQVGLLNMSNRANMDLTVMRLFQNNPLASLSNLSLYSGCFLSMSVIRQLVFDCPQLRALSFLQSETIDIAEVDELKAEVVKRNLNISLCCLELYDL